MNFWYALIITYASPFPELKTIIIYPDAASCGRGILTVEAAIFEAVPVSALQCRATGAARSSIIPKARPESLNANP